jgi:hypothetical protein
MRALVECIGGARDALAVLARALVSAVRATRSLCSRARGGGGGAK